MNIFVLHKDAIEAADMYCDKHVPKMVLELAQMLTTAHHAHGVARDGMYKVAHLNHPCSKWVRETGGNYRWAYHFTLCGWPSTIGGASARCTSHTLTTASVSCDHPNLSSATQA